ncbi:hypothetical protein E2562_021252 [Oryza meyeriana var. granulata]|uniref:Uncharacterized protein n=1 Tax=Oryza meyeriana var. granulata TaxID=110450 RepID=A0A6G1DZ86_9ORYZ|nr:hypothetical protein E2562_021252 [Oryza meyeriana var. granulata]
MANAAGHDGVLDDDDGESVSRPPAATLQDSDHKDADEEESGLLQKGEPAAANQRGIKHDDGEFSYSLRTWTELLQKWLPANQREERRLDEDDDSIFALPAWTGSWAPATTTADATGSDLQDLKSPTTASGSTPKSKPAPPYAHALECMDASVTASAPAPTTTAPEAHALASMEASDTASASKSKSPPPNARALLLASMEASDTDSMSKSNPAPPVPSHALAYMEAQDLLEDARRLATSLQDSRASLAAPAEELARALSTFVDKVGKKTAGVGDASDLGKAVSALLTAADSPKASEEAAGEGRPLATRTSQLILKVEEERHGRDRSCCAKVDKEQDGCDRSCCFCPWLFWSCTSPCLPRGGCSCCSSWPRRGIDDKQVRVCPSLPALCPSCVLGVLVRRAVDLMWMD